MFELNLTEKQFESDIEYSLLTYGGYEKGDPKAFLLISPTIHKNILIF